MGRGCRLRTGSGFSGQIWLFSILGKSLRRAVAATMRRQNLQMDCVKSAFSGVVLRSNCFTDRRMRFPTAQTRLRREQELEPSIRRDWPHRVALVIRKSTLSRYVCSCGRERGLALGFSLGKACATRNSHPPELNGKRRDMACRPLSLPVSHCVSLR
jgi:hypothetical protein